MSAELNVSLRVKALLDEARGQLAQFKRELADVRALSSATSTSAAQTAATTSAAASTSVGATQKTTEATDQATAATERHTSSKREQTQAEREAAAALQREATELQRTLTALGAAAPAAEKLAAVQTRLNDAVKRGAIDQDTYTRAMALADAKYRTVTSNVNAYGVSLGQTTAAMRQLPAQFTDIFTSLAGGQNPLLVAIQQGGQIKDSFGGARPAVAALTSVLTPFRVAVGLGSAAVGLLALSFLKGQSDSAEFQRSLVLTGNAAGQLQGDLDVSSRRVATAVGTTVGGARETLQTLVSTGRITSSVLEPAARAIELVAGTSGRTRAAIAADFAGITDDVVKWATKANEQYNFVDVALLSNIKRLQEQGKEGEAARLALEALSNHLGGNLTTNLGTVERAWQGVVEFMSKAKDLALSIGRQTGLEELVERAREAVKFAEENARVPIAGNAANGGVTSQAPVIAARQRLAELERTLAQGRERAATEADRAARNRAQIRAKEETDTQLAKYDKATELERRLAEARRRFETLKGSAAEISPDKQALIEKGIREEVMGKPAAQRGNPALQNARANAQVAQAQIAADLAVLEANLKAGDAAIVQALADGNRDIQSAYDARLAQLAVENKAQREALTESLTEVNEALRKAKTDAEKGPLREKQVQIQGKLRLLDLSLDEAARQLKLWKTDQERELATITAKVRVDVAGLTGQFDRQGFADQLRLQLEPDAKAAGRIADPAEREAAQARVSLLYAAGMAQAEFNSKVAEAQRLQQTLAVEEEAINGRVQRGQLGQLEGERQISALRAQQVPLLQAIAAELQRIRDALPPEARVAIDGMTVAIGQLANAATAATPVVVDATTRLRTGLRDAVPDLGAAALGGLASLRSAVANTLRQIAADIIRSGIKRAMSDQLTAGDSGGTGGGYWGLIIKGAKALFGFADGGQIKGPGTGTSDSIPALVNGRTPIAVSDGEFIQPNRAVNHYGLGFMEAVRTLKFPKPRFAFGGLVQASRRARFAAGGQVQAGADAGGITVAIRLENRGATPQRVVGTSQQVDGRQVIVSVLLDDVRTGGPISRALGVGR